MLSGPMLSQRLDLKKLAKLLGLLGSRHDGEALAAARKAHAMVTSSGETWASVIGLLARAELADVGFEVAANRARAAEARAAAAEAELLRARRANPRAWKYRSGFRYAFGELGSGTVLKAFRRRTQPVTYRLIVNFDDHGVRQIIAR